MDKKYIFLDLDGTILDHSTKSIPNSTKEAIRLAQEKGHVVIINTGRPPCLFYGIDKELGIKSFVAANGRYAVHNGEVILNMVIEIDTIKKVIEYCEIHKIDLGLEGLQYFKRQSSFSNIYEKFSKNFNLEIPVEDSNYYKYNDIYQMTLYYQENDYKKFEDMFPNLTFAYSCEYGIDVNTKGGLKEQGIEAFMRKYSISMENIIAIGDGFNDISMLDYVKHSVAMGNAHQEVQKHAKYVTDHVSNDGLYKAFKKLNLI